MMKNYKETLLDKGRKLVSLMLCALTVSACNDDDCINGGTDNNNLQVEVSASLHSRVPIHDSTLPDNNPISVTLTATDGSSYDNQNYNNIPYYGITADGKQTWQPQDKPVTLSVTEGVAMAYWPYNKDAADMTAVPVETDSQTDYMYSGNVTGLTNATPKAAFQMKHAMALVRVNVVRGTYTAAGTVTAVTAASEAFCTSGTMNVSTGALANLVGAETPFIEEPADAVITTSGRMTEFLVLPDVDVDAASVTLGVTVDGRKYNTAVEVTEAFKQGYIYTYNLTLDNTALNMSGVTVTPWQEGNSLDSSLTMTYNEDEYVVNILIENNNSVYIHNVYNMVGVVNWGDGTVSTYDTPTSWPEHTYSSEGIYTVTVKGICPRLYGFCEGYGVATPYIVDILHIGSQMNITEMYYAFDNTPLTSIRKNIFDGLTEVTTFAGTFAGCKGLTSIPAGLFDNCPKVTSFERTFFGCSGITEIPAGLFDNCTEVTSFESTFQSCTALTGNIPEELFDNCTEVTGFAWTFKGCSSLTAIPEGLFKNNKESLDFWSTFAECSGITSIPVGLFDNNTKVTSFGYAFEKCTGLMSIPEGLFDKCTEVTDFAYAFNGCTALTNIPAGLFDNNTKVTGFGYAFKNTAITKIPAGLFDKCTEVTIFNSTFENTAITEIPQGLFDKCTKALAFANTFSGCTALTGESPYTLINVDGTDVKVHLYERSSYPEHFAAPVNYKKCFNGCVGLTDYTNIPSTWY